MEICPLCQVRENTLFFKDKRSYHRCSNCFLIFVTEGQRISSKEEKAIYDLHENEESDEGYRNFLSRLANPLIEKLSPASYGLDFGCGPGPTLSKIFEEAGHKMDLYDIFYQKNNEVFKKSYDFIVATEVVEHLFEPGRELQRLLGLLKEGAPLGIMTKLALDKEAFSKWHYKNDPTHVCFFSKETFHWLEKEWNLNCDVIGNDVIILSKQP